jgi:hypothetical protein
MCGFHGNQHKLRRIGNIDRDGTADIIGHSFGATNKRNFHDAFRLGYRILIFTRRRRPRQDVVPSARS